MEAIEHLNECIWSHPSDYGGFSPDGDYVIYSRNRDSSILEESNYERIFDDLKKISDKHQTDNTGSFVYDFRVSHWACGWVEYLLVTKIAPDEIKQTAGEIICALADYPVYDESDYSEREHNAVYEYWDNMSVSDRVEYCQDAGESIFSARGNLIPENVYYNISESF